MTISQEIFDFNLPVVELNPNQRSLVNFMYTTDFGLANSPRQIGMTTALISYMAWLMETGIGRNILVVNRTNQQASEFMRNFMDHYNKIASRSGRVVSRSLYEDAHHGNTLRSISIDVLENTSRGASSQIDAIFFDNWDVDGPYATKIQRSLPTLLPTMKLKSQVYILGTTCGTFKDSPEFSDDSLIASAIQRKSYFKLWCHAISENVDDLVNM